MIKRLAKHGITPIYDMRKGKIVLKHTHTWDTYIATGMRAESSGLYKSLWCAYLAVFGM